MARTGYVASNGAVSFDSRGFLFVYMQRGTTSGLQPQIIYGHYSYACGGWSSYFGGDVGKGDTWRDSGDYYAQGSSSNPTTVVGSIVSDMFYTVICTVEGGGGSLSGGGEYRNGTKVTITAKPNTGYIVDLLHGVKQDGKKGEKTTTVVASSDTTVLASFKQYYQILFDVNGGVKPSSGLSTIDLCFAGTEYKLPTAKPTRTGYEFLGWALSSAATEADYQSGGDFVLETIPSSGLHKATLYAVWKQYAIAYDSNGGSAVDSQVYYGNVTLAAAPTRAGYVFGGWDIDGTVYAAGATYNLQANVTAKAVWVGNGGTIANVSIPDIVPPQNILIDVVIPETGIGTEGKTITATAPTTGLIGIEFSHWEVTGVPVDDPSANPLVFTMPSNDVSVTAVYVLRKLEVDHSVDFFSQVATDGETSITDKDGNAADELYYGDEVVFHAPVAKDGYEFSGWYDGDVRVSQLQNYTMSLTGDISLVAKYSTYVTFTKTEESGTQGALSLNGTEYTQPSVTLSAELGSMLQIAAVATSGFFGGWYVGGELQELFREDEVRITNTATYEVRFVAELAAVNVTCASEKNSADDVGSLGSLAVVGDSVEDKGGGSFEVLPFTEVTLVATPSGNSDALPLFRVVEEVGGLEVAVDISKPVRILMSARSFTAKWGAKGKFRVTVSSSDTSMGIAYIGESAGITSLEEVQDSIVTVTALPSNGYRFDGWYLNGVKVSDAARYVFPVVEEVSLEARFAEDAAAICVWEGGGENKRLSWKSKVFVMPRPFDPVAARVDAVGYPVSLSVGTYSSPDAVPTRDHDVQVQNQSGRRLPRMRAERFLRISLESAHEIDSVVVATNLVEVN